MKALREATRAIYDVASPELLEVFGPHLHDGYYETGEETRLEAQEKSAWETAHMAPSWGIALEDLARSALWRLARKLGVRAVPLVAVARAMKRAIRAGELVYAFITARA